MVVSTGLIAILWERRETVASSSQTYPTLYSSSQSSRSGNYAKRYAVLASKSRTSRLGRRSVREVWWLVRLILPIWSEEVGKE